MLHDAHGINARTRNEHDEIVFLCRAKERELLDWGRKLRLLDAAAFGKAGGRGGRGGGGCMFNGVVGWEEEPEETA